MLNKELEGTFMNKLNTAASYMIAVDDAYTLTMKAFAAAKRSNDHYKYVVPESTAPNPGFAIFYTPPIFRPPLLIVGQNPANFAGARRAYTDPPNGQMLAGHPPTVNSYLQHDHEFATTLRRLFRDFPHLLETAVGMNLWHFQMPPGVKDLPPSSFRAECEKVSCELIEAMEPRAILCFSSRARDLLAKQQLSNYWYVPHPTGSRTRDQASAAMPAVLAEIDGFLKNSESSPAGKTALAAR
jgi:hypothetical protein